MWGGARQGQRVSSDTCAVVSSVNAAEKSARIDAGPIGDWMGAMTMKGKFTMKITSPTTYNFSFEASQDGTKWMTVMDGKATKK